MEISRLAIIYGTKGGEEAVRMDKRVRTSLLRTSKTAKKDKTHVMQWFEAHKSAIVAIGAATTGVLAAILKSTPTLMAELGSIRLAFSMLAMEVGQLLIPLFITLEGWAWKLSDGFSKLPLPVKTALSAMIIFALIVIALTVAIIGLVAVAGAAGLSLAALVMIGAVIAMYTVLIGVVVYLEKRFGIFTKTLAALLPFLKYVLQGFIDFGKGIKKVLYGLIDLAKIIVDSFKNIGTIIHGPLQDAILSLVDDALVWGKDFADNFIKGISSGVDRISAVFEPIAAVFSHDRSINDRRTFKWGVDFADYFISGAKRVFSGIGMDQFMTTPTATATPAAAAPMVGGSSVSITIAQGAITMMGGETSDISMETIVDKLYNRIRDDMGARF